MTLDDLRREIAARVALGDADPDEGHATIDGLTEAVLEEVAAGHADSREMARLVVELLDLEQREGWRRWYA